MLNRFRGELVLLDARGEGASGFGGGAGGSFGGGSQGRVSSSSDAPASFDRNELDDEIPF